MSTKTGKPDKYPWEVGMTVASFGTNYNTSIRLGKIEKLTKYSVFVAFNGYVDKFSRSDGMKKVSTYTREVIEPATQAHRDIIEHQRLANRLARVKWDKMSLDLLKRISAIQDEESAKK